MDCIENDYTIENDDLRENEFNFYDFLRFCTVDEKNCYNILKNFENEDLNNISFYNTDITGESLAKFIKDQPKKLKYINLDNVKNLNLKHLKETFSKSTYIKELNLYNNNLVNQLSYLNIIINSNKSIETLNIGKTDLFNISDTNFEDLDNFIEAIQYNETIKTLKMKYTFKNKRRIINLIFEEGLKYNKSIETLDLSNNDIFDCEVISESIKNNINLKKIDLSNNIITNEDLRDLLQGLRNVNRKSILNINLKNNKYITYVYKNQIPKYVLLEVNNIEVL
jgi:hypothetical protein